MLFLERLAEQRIEEAMARGEFDNLSCAGKPLPEGDDLPWVMPGLRKDLTGRQKKTRLKAGQKCKKEV